MSPRRSPDNEPINGWTVHTLKVHIEQIMHERDQRYEDRFNAQEQSIKLALGATDKAMVVARESVDKRLDTMNEFREALVDQTKEYLTRTEYAIQHQALTDGLNNHITQENDKRAAQEDRQDAKLKQMKDSLENINKWLVGLLGGVAIALILTIVDILVRTLS
jgi:hypothetical protein